MVRGFESLPPHHYRFVNNVFNLHRKKIAKIIANICQLRLSVSVQLTFSIVSNGFILVKSPMNKIDTVVNIIQKDRPGAYVA